MIVEPTQSSPAAFSGVQSNKPQSVARQFEAMIVSIMLKSMRSSVMKSELVPESTAEKMYADLLDKEYASLLANHASFGLSDLILRELDHDQKGQTHGALSMLQNLQAQQRAYESAAAGHSFNAGALGARAQRWDSIIADAAQRYNLDRNLIAAVVAQESAGNPLAVSHAGAKGLMQLIDSTAREMGVTDVFNPRQNIMGGARYLRGMLDMHNGDERLALASYNAGPAAVKRYNGVPPYRETQDYVQRVLHIRNHLAAANTRPEADK